MHAAPAANYFFGVARASSVALPMMTGGYLETESSSASAEGGHAQPRIKIVADPPAIIASLYDKLHDAGLDPEASACLVRSVMQDNAVIALASLMRAPLIRHYVANAKALYMPNN